MFGARVLHQISHPNGDTAKWTPEVKVIINWPAWWKLKMNLFIRKYKFSKLHEATDEFLRSVGGNIFRTHYVGRPSQSSSVFLVLSISMLFTLS